MSGERTAVPTPAHGRRRNMRLVALAAALAVLLVAVSLLVLGLLGFLRWPSSGDDSTRASVRGEHVAFAVEFPGARGIWSIDSPIYGADCPSVRYRMGALVVESYSTACRIDPDQQINNENHGRYRRLEHVPEPLDVRKVGTNLGAAAVFTQQYVECTNSCESYQEPVAIVVLEDPVDPAFPTLVLRSDRAELSREELAVAVRSLGEPH